MTQDRPLKGKTPLLPNAIRDVVDKWRSSDKKNMTDHEKAMFSTICGKMEDFAMNWSARITDDIKRTIR
jgi:hypothetical protein